MYLSVYPLVFCSWITQVPISASLCPSASSPSGSLCSTTCLTSPQSPVPLHLKRPALMAILVLRPQAHISQGENMNKQLELVSTYTLSSLWGGVGGRRTWCQKGGSSERRRAAACMPRWGCQGCQWLVPRNLNEVGTESQRPNMAMAIEELSSKGSGDKCGYQSTCVE